MEAELRCADFARLAQYFTLDSITDLGAPFRYLEKDEDLYGFIKTVQDHLPVIKVLGTLGCEDF